jgi:hypothetical protein
VTCTLFPGVPFTRAVTTIRFEETTMETLNIVLDTLFALGGLASLALLAWGGWLVLNHSPGVVKEARVRSDVGIPVGRASRAR